jgi:hypothetical protein
MGSLYGYAGYLMGFRPAIGIACWFTAPDRDRGIEQNVPLRSRGGQLVARVVDRLIAILAGVSVPYGFRAAGSRSISANRPPAPTLMAAIGFRVAL